MKVTIEFQSEIQASLQELFDYHNHPLAFQRLLPPWEKIKVIHKDPGLEVGCKTHIQIPIIGKLKKDFIVKHTECDVPVGFTDEQVLGPFRSYRHNHIFTEKKGKTFLIDHMEYELPGKFFGHMIGGWYVKRSFKRMFRYRHKLISEDFKHMSKEKNKPRYKVLISGSHGFVGKQLSCALSIFGFDVHHLVRKQSNNPKEVFWDLKKKILDSKKLEGFDYVIHLSGESIAGKRWSRSRRKKIFNSRVQSTEFLASKLESLQTPPKGFFVASGINFYGRKARDADENTKGGEKGFLTDLAKAWEKASQTFTKGRVINMRFGMVLGLRGGALKAMVSAFQKNLGAVFGSGEQHISWIVIDDLIYQIYHLLCDETASGPYNFVSPNPVTNAEFSKMLAKILNKALFLKIPEFFIKLIFGKQGKELLLSDLKIIPKRFQEKQAYFSYPTLFDALKHLFGK